MINIEITSIGPVIINHAAGTEFIPLIKTYYNLSIINDIRGLKKENKYLIKFFS